MRNLKIKSIAKCIHEDPCIIPNASECHLYNVANIYQFVISNSTDKTYPKQVVLYNLNKL